MFDLARGVTDRFLTMPPYGIAAMFILVLYAVQAEIRFGAKARAMRAGAADRGSTIAVSLASAVPLIGFFLAMEGRIPMTLPGMPAVAWFGVLLGALGFVLRCRRCWRASRALHSHVIDTARASDRT